MKHGRHEDAVRCLNLVAEKPGQSDGRRFRSRRGKSKHDWTEQLALLRDDDVDVMYDRLRHGVTG